MAQHPSFGDRAVAIASILAVLLTAFFGAEPAREAPAAVATAQRGDR